MGSDLCTAGARRFLVVGSAGCAAVPEYPPIPEFRLFCARLPAPGGRDMELMRDLAVQGVQMALVLALAPLLTGWVRKCRAHFQRRQGASIFQPDRDLARLLKKDVVLAENASWLIRAAPYLVFAGT